MGYNKIRKMDISDGPGVRVSIFMQGCAFNCKNCFNPETHDFKGGKEFTDETINRILELSDNDNIEGLSILGGEPMHPRNIENTTKLAKAFKEKYPNKITAIEQENKGVARTRNESIKRATGKYIMFMDNDDYLDKDYIETFVKEIEKDDCDAVIGGYRRITETGKILKTLKLNDGE